MKIFSMITLSILISGCYGTHHHRMQIPNTHSHRYNQLEMEIGGSLYVDDIIR